MPSEILGLPLHPLAIHLPVVFVPLLAGFVVGYVLIPGLRARIGWVMVGLGVIAPATTVAAVLSGRQLAQDTVDALSDSPEAAAAAAETIGGHSRYGDVLVWLVAALTLFSWLFAVLVSGRLAEFADRRSWQGLAEWSGPGHATTGDTSPQAGTRQLLVTSMGMLLLVLAVIAIWYVFQAGHSGAEMLWGD